MIHLSTRRVFGGFLIGILLIQAAWIAAVPAFRGPDEFDHVFHAEGVVHGAYRSGHTISPRLARGTLIPVRRSVIEAASKVCASYPYTRLYDCYSYGDYDGDLGRVGSGAAGYNPAYYVVVGNAARPFHGVAVDYAIRALTAGICALMLAWAAALWTRLGRSRWRTLAFMTALTPVLLFSTTIAAPNGVSYAAAVLLWVAGLVILDGPERGPRSAGVAAAVGAVVMCNTHTTGPLWLLLIAVAWLLLRPKALLRTLADRRYWVMVAVIALGTAASVLWTLTSRANLPSGSGSGAFSGGPQIGPLAGNEVAWLLQTIAVFPLRNQMAPPAVYVLWLIAFVFLLVHAAKRGGNGLVAVLGIIGGLLAVQTALTYLAFQTDGYAWQGRYGLPLAVGLALIPGFIDTGRRAPYGPLYHCALLGIFIANALSVWHVGDHDRLFVQRPWTDHVAAGPILAGLLAGLGTALITWVLAPREPLVVDEPVSTAASRSLDQPRTGEVVR